MGKRYRRSPEELIQDYKTKIAELEQKRKSLEMAKDPAVKAMRMVRMHLRKACGLSKSGGPFAGDFNKQATSFLETLDTVLVGFGARRPRKRRRGAGGEA